MDIWVSKVSKFKNEKSKNPELFLNLFDNVTFSISDLFIKCLNRTDKSCAAKSKYASSDSLEELIAGECLKISIPIGFSVKYFLLFQKMRLCISIKPVKTNLFFKSSCL